MNDIWNFILGLGDGLQDALSAVNVLPILVVALVIGIVFKPEQYAVKALVALILVLAIRIMWPTLSGHRAALPDLRHLSAIVQIFLLYVFAFGMIGMIGSLKSVSKGAAKAAH